MRITEFEIRNYKSFVRSVGRLTEGFNIILGRNNSGKTAALEGLSMRFSNHPHRSRDTVPYRGGPVSPGTSTIRVTVRLGRQEFIGALTRSGSRFYLPPHANAQQSIEHFREATAAETVTVTVERSSAAVTAVELLGYGNIAAAGQALEVAWAIDSGGANVFKQLSHRQVPVSDSLGGKIAEWIRDRVYAFRAERMNVGSHVLGEGTTTLDADASNLPQVLADLQTRNPERFRRFVAMVHKVLPEVHQVTIWRQGTTAHIHLWFEPLEDRDDLGIPLADSGTGVGQVLAILYVLLAADEPQILMIDEPQSFLHAGAARTLLQILQLHSQHQYILTTHSPIALTAVEFSRILHAKRSGMTTSIQSIDVADAECARSLLADVGVRLSDVFGAERVIWVEGLTEERCFPRIVGGILRQPLTGTVILAVKHTGDLKGSRARTMLEIHDRLPTQSPLLPTGLAFVLDREGLTESGMSDLERQSSGRMRFLPRRMFENYLLNPRAIAAVASSIDGFRDEPVAEEEVRTWLEARMGKAEYMKLNDGGIPDGDPERYTHGKRLLKDLFAQLSCTKVSYDPVRHGKAITEWLVEHAPDDLKDVSELLRDVLENHEGVVGDGG